MKFREGTEVIEAKQRVREMDGGKRETRKRKNEENLTHVTAQSAKRRRIRK